MKHIALVILSMLLYHPSMGQEEKSDPPRIGVKVPLGETVMVQGHRITFVQVLQDNRCPAKVDCIWAGEATVKVQVSGPEISPGDIELVFKGGRDASAELPVLIQGADWKLCGLALQPYPQHPGEEMQYVLLIGSFVKAQ